MPPSRSSAGGRELKEFGSFHVGGRQVRLSGHPVTEAVFIGGAAPSRVDPNGEFEVGQMYVQYLARRRGPLGIRC